MSIAVASPQSKPFPMPGMRWQWMGNHQCPEQGQEKAIRELRWFQGHVEAVFTDGNCAGVGHLLNNEAWRYCGTTEAVDNAEVLLTAIRSQGAKEERGRCVNVCERGRNECYGKADVLPIINGMAISIAHSHSSTAHGWRGDRTTCERMLAAYVNGAVDEAVASEVAKYNVALQDLNDTIPARYALPDFVDTMERKIGVLLRTGNPLLTAPRGVIEGVYYVCSRHGGCEGSGTTNGPRKCPNCKQPCIAVDEDGDYIDDEDIDKRHDATSVASTQDASDARARTFEARWNAASCDALGDISATGVGCCGICYSSQGPCDARGNCDCHTKDGRPVTR